MRYSLIFILILISCQTDEPFDPEKWKKKGVDWQLADTRERMVNDLVSSDTLIGLSKKEVLKLLGQPETSEELRLKYLIREKHEWNIDPEYIKYLWIDLDQNKKAINIQIEVTK